MKIILETVIKAPRLCIAFVAVCFIHVAALADEPKPMDNEFLEFSYGQDSAGNEWIQSIEVLTPNDRSDVSGDVVVRFRAPGMKIAKAMCWRQPTDERPSSPWGHDANLTHIPYRNPPRWRCWGLLVCHSCPVAVSSTANSFFLSRIGRPPHLALQPKW